jgi:hypothetical protein
MNKTKVYCKNCKNLTTADGFSILICIISSEARDWYSAKTKTYKQYEPKLKNVGNNCSFYRRKWWKFWVKEKKISL